MLSGCSTRPVVSPPLPSSFLGSTKAFLSSFSFPGVNRCPVLSVNRKVRKYGAISRFNSEEDTPPDPKTSVLALILGGGKGTRLYPLTKSRAKPAVPLGANYRLIDIPVSNCINSDITKIYVLTQFNSTSLNSHIYRAYSGNMVGFRDDSFVEVLAAEQTLENQFWFQGTADAVRQYLWLFEDPTVKEFLILAGDHLYRMDYQVFIKHHRRSKADITVAAVPVSEDKATSLGLMKINPEGDIIEFAEKPEGSALKAMKVDTTILGLDDGKAKEMPYIASMGIYVISKEAMMNLLLKQFPDANDFGSQIIPGATEVGMKVQAYLFHGYWEDIGTIKSFYDANIGMTKNTPVFSFYDKKSPMYTLPRCLAPSKISNAHVNDSVIGEGCHIKDCRILHSVIGLRSQISAGAVIEDTFLMGADYYETQEEQDAILSCGGIPVGVGKHSHVRKAIVDKNARIGEHVKIMNTDNVLEAAKELQGFYIKDGIVVILKDALISNGTVI